MIPVYNAQSKAKTGIHQATALGNAVAIDELRFSIDDLGSLRAGARGAKCERLQ